MQSGPFEVDQKTLTQGTPESSPNQLQHGLQECSWQAARHPSCKERAGPQVLSDKIGAPNASTVRLHKLAEAELQKVTAPGSETWLHSSIQGATEAGVKPNPSDLEPEVKGHVKVDHESSTLADFPSGEPQLLPSATPRELVLYLTSTQRS